jgi:acyl-coenzyme A thioesterase PaaI-like protein
MKMASLNALFRDAKNSAWKRFLLNRILWAGIPFNAPHRLRIVDISDEQVRIAIPFIKRNLNHLRSLHACVMATAAEYASGLMLLQHFDAARYRLIMQKIEVEYHYQGKKAAYSKAELTIDSVQSAILNRFAAGEDKVVFQAQAEVFDLDGKHLCTATIYWQIKDWKTVRTATA